MSGPDDVEIGPLRPGESDSFLGVMCEAFGMDFRAAKPIFDADPYFDSQNKIALRAGGEIVSCLTVVDRECRLGGARPRVAGIAGVATLPSHRKRGYAGRLLTETVRTLASRGFHLAALYPVDPPYYRRFGWESAGVQFTSRARCGPGRAIAGKHHVRPAAPADIPELASIYDRGTAGLAMRCTRDRKRWKYLLSYLPESRVACSGGGVEAYALCALQAERDRSPDGPCASHEVRASECETGPGAPLIAAGASMGAEPDCESAAGIKRAAQPEAATQTLRVHELEGSDEAVRALRIHLAIRSGASELVYSQTPAVLERQGFPPPNEEREGLMARIVDWHGLLQALAANWRGVEGELGLALLDPLLSSAPRAAIVRASGGAVTVTPCDPAALASGCPNLVVGEVSAWSPVVVGHVSAGSACRAGALKASSADAAAVSERLFPAREPFIPTADHF